MSDLMDLFGGSDSSGIEIGTVTESLGNNKYLVSVRGDVVTAVSAVSGNIRAGGQAVISLSDSGWYIVGQPKNVVGSERVTVVIKG